jgi:quinol monooxygenase YgiN
MTVIVIADVQGQTAAGYDGMFQALAEPTRQATGFVLHSAYQVDGLWRVVEVWDSKAEANQFFARHVAAQLPPGVRPKRAVFELHSLITK